MLVLEAPKLATPKFTTEYLRPEQEQRLTDYLLTRKPHACGTGDWRYEMHDLGFMYLDTGSRYCEIARLEWSQVDLKQKTIELWRNKIKTESFIYMTDPRAPDSCGTSTARAKNEPPSPI